MPLLWIQINDAAKDSQVCKTTKAKDIKEILVQKNPQIFHELSINTLHGCIDYARSPPQWSENVLKMAEKGNRQGGQGGRIGLFVCAFIKFAPAAYLPEMYWIKYPNSANELTITLQTLCKNGAPLTIVSIQGIAIAAIQKISPQMFQEKFKDGSQF